MLLQVPLGNVTNSNAEFEQQIQSHEIPKCCSAVGDGDLDLL